MIVNWLMIEISDDSGKVTYRNSFVTDLVTGAKVWARPSLRRNGFAA
jgi:hypothetical protein